MLSQFSADFFARSPVLAGPVVALGIFIVVFVAVSVRAARTKKTELDRMAALPLAD